MRSRNWVFILTDKYLDIPLNHPKSINQRIKHSGTQTVHKIDWKSGALDYSRVNTMLAELRQYGAEYFAKVLEK